MVKKFSVFAELEYLSPCSWKSASGTYLEPVQSSSHYYTLFT